MKGFFYLVVLAFGIVYILSIEELYSFPEFFEDAKALWDTLFMRI